MAVDMEKEQIKTDEGIVWMGFIVWIMRGEWFLDFWPEWLQE